MAIKIALFKAKSLGFERDMVSFSLKYKNFPALLVKAIVDTGCPFTVLSQSALSRTRIPPGELYQVVDLGPIRLELRKLGVCELTFRSEDAKPISFKHEVYYGMPRTKERLAQELPSFVGKDFIDNHYISIQKTKQGSFLQTESVESQQSSKSHKD